MKFFTPQLYAQLQSKDAASMNAADAAWELASAQYDSHLLLLGRAVQPVLEKFQGILLHDAEVLSILRQGNRLLFTLRREIPPRSVVTLVYTLAAEPFVNKTAIEPENCAKAMWFEYDEIDVVSHGDETVFEHSILFSNGWEIRVQFRDVMIEFAEPVYPVSRSADLSPTIRRDPACGLIRH